jgi:micrococcal nuclease
VHPSNPVQCYGNEASDKNKERVLGKDVILEKDVSETDRYGRLLRYVWIEGVMVNELLVREGYAQSSSYPPDIKYQSKFIEAQRLAREEAKGLWSSFCDSWTPPTTTNTTNNTAPSTSSDSTNTGSWECNCKKTCTQITTCEEAYFQLNECGCTDRDGNGDGVPCETICR